MNAYIETLNEILGGIPRDTIHAEQRRAMQYAIDLATHPSRGVVDVESALQRAYNLGQTYWQQADSEYASDHRKASETAATFRQLVIDTVAALPAVPEFNQRAFGLACTVAWTELVNALRADGHAVGDKSGPATREWIVGIVRDTFAATPAHDQPEGSNNG